MLADIVLHSLWRDGSNVSTGFLLLVTSPRPSAADEKGRSQEEAHADHAQSESRASWWQWPGHKVTGVPVTGATGTGMHITGSVGLVAVLAMPLIS